METNLIQMKKSASQKQMNELRLPSEREFFSTQEKEQISDILYQVCCMQKGYGDTPDKFSIRLKGFLWALEKFPIEKIIAAFRYYCLHNNDIPTPADIAKLIEDEGKPVMDGKVYASIKQRLKDPYGPYVTNEEKEYVHEYERQKLKGHKL